MARRDRIIEHVVGQGLAHLRPDPERRDAFTLEVGGMPQSHVDLADPRHLSFDYVRHIAHVVDLIEPRGGPLEVVHLGFGAGTLARYVAVSRPRSRQRVFEIDGPLVEWVRRELPLPARIRIGIQDAGAGIASLREGAVDVVISDVFTGGRTPEHLAGPEFVGEIRRALRPEGTYLVNVTHEPRRAAGLLCSEFRHVVILGDPAVIAGKRAGNLVLAATDAPLDLPALRRAVGSVSSVLSGADLAQWLGPSR